jgi:hypothetical protein
MKILFGKAITTTNVQITENGEFEDVYEATASYNISAMFANKIAMLATAESSASVYEEGGDKKEKRNTKRTEILDKALGRVWFDLRKIVSRMCGTGGVAIVPYVEFGGIYFDIVAQGNIAINRARGEEIVSATVLADEAAIGEQKYYRWIDYDIDIEGDTGVLTIRNKAVRGDGQIPVPLSEVGQWAGIAEEIRINNVRKVPFGYFKSPCDNRKVNNTYGVPLTYGQEDIIKDIVKTLEQIEREYDLKEPFVAVSENMLDGNNKMPKSRMFRMFQIQKKDNAPMWELYDPAIRDASLYNKLQNQFALLEKAVATSRGVLTDRTTTGATATELKISNYDTYALVDAVRAATKRGIEDFIEACNILAEYANLTPPSAYTIGIEWSYAMIENSMETWQQTESAVGLGLRTKAEARQYLTGETIEEAEAMIKYIDENEPPLRNMLAVGGAYSNAE